MVTEIVGNITYNQSNWVSCILVLVCKGICERHKALKPTGFGRYFSGQKRCQICEIFIKWGELWSPRCGYRLRTRPRSRKYKIKLRERESKIKQGVYLSQ